MTKVGLISLGCSKNRVDSENLLGQFRKAGYQIVADPAEAEIIVVNTCGFIESAKEESIDAIFEMSTYRQTGQLKKLIVTGCLAQRYGETLREAIPEVDVFLGVAEYERIFEAIAASDQGETPLFTGEGNRFYRSPRVLTTASYSAYVKISDGCDNKCTYCAIPLIRGGYRSRPYEEIIAECKELAARGVTELTLIAQDTSRYGNDFPEGMLLLPSLLREVSEIEGVHWVRVLYCYPDTVTDELLDCIATLPKVCKYMDLPLQHTNGRMLKLMNRRGSPDLIRALIEKCRSRGISVRTTMMVGFPGETEEEFEEMLGFVESARFDRLGAFTFSPEDGTAAAQMGEQIDEETKEYRLDKLMTLQQGISLAENEARVGTTCEVLVEGEKNGLYYGRSPMEAPEIDGKVFFTSDRKHAPGDYVWVRATSATEYDLNGEAINDED